MGLNTSYRTTNPGCGDGSHSACPPSKVGPAISRAVPVFPFLQRYT